MSNENNMSHYHVNIASLLAIGEWLDYLKENDVYDNTRIIIVSDHGRGLGQFDYMKLSNGIDVEWYNPLLLIKDFESNGLNTSNEFMTNADVPAIAISGQLLDSTNPFTGNDVTDNDKNKEKQILTTSNKSAISLTGKVFDTSDGEWYSAKENIFDVNNWQKEDVAE